jgi:nitrite reductase/ring-hydroxylating ferredoxin subunit
VLPSEPKQIVYGLEDWVVTCPRHKWQFGLETGRALVDPLIQAPMYEVAADGERIIVYDAQPATAG